MALITIKQYIKYIRFLWMQIFIAVGTIVCLAWGSFFLALMYLMPADPRFEMDRLSIGWAFIVNFYICAVYGMITLYRSYNKEDYKYKAIIESLLLEEY